MDVLILSHKPEVTSVRRLDEEFRRAGHTSILVEPENEALKKMPADLIIPRLGGYRFEESLAMVEWLERRGRRLLNRPAPLRDARNKWVAYLILQSDGLPQPYSRSLPKSELPTHFPYIVKEPELGRGEGVHLIQNREDLMALSAEQEWMYQEWVGDNEGRDLRLLVTQDRLIAAMERRAKAGEFRSNLFQGGSAHPYTPSSLEIDLACQAVRSLGLDIAGVDLIPSRQGPMILEVNGCPGFEGLEKASGVNVARAYVEWAEERVRQ